MVAVHSVLLGQIGLADVADIEAVVANTIGICQHLVSSQVDLRILVRSSIGLLFEIEDLVFFGSEGDLTRSGFFLGQHVERCAGRQGSRDYSTGIVCFCLGSNLQADQHVRGITGSRILVDVLGQVL